MLCVLILYISGGTYRLKSTPNDRLFEKIFMTILFTLRVFVRNLLRGSWNLDFGPTNKRALKKIHGVHHRFIVHSFRLVHGHFICLHKQQYQYSVRFRGIPYFRVILKQRYTMFRQALLLSQYSFICEQYFKCFKCSDT